MSKLSLSYTAEDSKATIAINNPNLIIGTTDVVITVTSESGAKKTYTIKVTREQDPNYKASSDARLSEITLSSGALSPIFDSDKTDYIVYVPYETATITVGGKAKDAKAQNVTEKSFNLIEGENKVTISGIAEDGSKKEYSLHIIRMPEYIGKVPDISIGENIEKVSIAGEIIIKGNPEVGQTLTIASTLQSEAAVDYEWYADSKLVGTGNVYNVSKEDADKVITVKAKGTGTYEGEVVSKGVKAIESDAQIIKIKSNEGVNYIVVIVLFLVALAIGFMTGFGTKRRNIAD